MSKPEFTSKGLRNRTIIAATVVAAAAGVLWWGILPRGIMAETGRTWGDGGGCGESDHARGGQITTMVARFNLFHPGDAERISLVDGRVYAATDFAPLVTAGYCAGADLEHPIAGKGWVWNGTTRKFEPERP